MGFIALNVNVDGRPEGYFRGVGADEGRFCLFSPDENAWVVADGMAPRVFLNDSANPDLRTELHRLEFLYNGAPVYANAARTFFVFDSFGYGWIGFTSLAEPVSYYDLDGYEAGTTMTLLGDAWMELSSAPPTALSNLSATITSTGAGLDPPQVYDAGVSVELSVAHYIGSPLSETPFGPYRFEGSGQIIVVGTPEWIVQAARASGLNGLTVSRATERGAVVYPMSNGMRISWSAGAGAWVVGEPGVSERWWIGNGPPNYTRWLPRAERVECAFSAFDRSDDPAGEANEDYNFTVSLRSVTQGGETYDIFVGEVSQWA